MKKELKGTYTSPLSCTQQCRWCGNPLRVDMYKGCTFGCNYCFSNTRQLKGNWGDTGEMDFANIEQIERMFKRAFSNEELRDIDLEMLRHKVPLHCGGMSDPFQHREFKLHLTYALIELSNKYDYPITFSTKQHELPEEYWEILNPKLHAFQVSILGYSDEFIKKYETRTGTAEERIQFLKKLHDKGFWTALRIQPLINIEEAITLTKRVCELGAVDYITIEHLKIPNDNPEARQLFLDVPGIENYKELNGGGRGMSPTIDIKLSNFKTISDIANQYGIKVGAGDNDLHFLSQSRCCCGIDTIPSEHFKNWFKYNLTYFITSKDDVSDFDSIWFPKNTFSMPFLKKGEPRAISIPDYFQKFINGQPNLIPINMPNVRAYFKLSNKKRLF